jgi:hypothetical protein
MIEIGMVFTAVEVGTKIAQYLGFVEGIEKKLERLEGKIDRLTDSELRTGWYLLEQAAKADQEFESLVRDARDHLAKAVHLESNLALVHAHVGLALCHQLLNESTLMLSELRAASAACARALLSPPVTKVGAMKRIKDVVSTAEKVGDAVENVLVGALTSGRFKWPGVAHKMSNAEAAKLAAVEWTQVAKRYQSSLQQQIELLESQSS